MLGYGAGAAFFCLEPELTQFGQSRSWLQDLDFRSRSKKVAAPQHCIFPLCTNYYLSYAHSIISNVHQQLNIFPLSTISLSFQCTLIVL